MNVRLATVLVVVIVSASLIAAFTDREAWQEFKERFDKNYTSQHEEEYRMKIFFDNKHYIETYNTKETESLTFSQGINQLSDLTNEEINQTRCGFRFPEDYQPEEVSLNGLQALLNLTGEGRAWYDSFVGPQSLDYRESKRVSRVKDQGSCGSCWAFATTGALESILASHDRGILLSEQNLVDCSRRYGNEGCSGGLMDRALKYVRDHGIMSGQEYPYKAKEGECKFKDGHSIISVRGSVTLPRGNEGLLRIALARTGPIPVAIDAQARSFQSYQSGVYNDRKCRSNSLNHAVLLVGYGTDTIGGDYWLLKNSWGNKWGDSGYIKIARNKGNLCGIASYAVLPIQ